MEAVLLGDQSLLRMVLRALPSSLDVRRASAVCRAWRSLCLQVLALHYVPEVAWCEQETQLPVGFSGHAAWFCPQRNTLTLCGGHIGVFGFIAKDHNQAVEVIYHGQGQGQGHGSPPCNVVSCELRGTPVNCCCSVTDDGRQFRFGGYAKGTQITDSLSELRKGENGCLRWRQVTAKGEAPPKIAGASMVYDSAGDQFIVFGGRDGACSDRLRAFQFEGERWTAPPVSGDLPSPRTNHRAVMLSGRRMLLCGGVDPDHLPCPAREATPPSLDVFLLDTASWCWTKIKTASSEPFAKYRRQAQLAVVEIAQHEWVFLYGGITANSNTNTLSENLLLALDTVNWTWHRCVPCGWTKHFALGPSCSHSLTVVQRDDNGTVFAFVGADRESAAGVEWQRRVHYLRVGSAAFIRETPSAQRENA
eukprot:TRINITY_DN437_c0_g1_i15.p1 TRINITY_DN437_c0_g1~~TRINITY_DN437_c0_g1_i15.p1  ORF type:complete len:419 (+),score=73.45 TRINITY_DN437_c0_g1_i15:74-1330(+)